MVVDDVDVDFTPPVPWTIEQLNALGPVTGPSHRTFVPIVRGTLQENSLGDVRATLQDNSLGDLI